MSKNKPDGTLVVPVQIDVDTKGFLFETGNVFRGLTVSPAVEGWNCVIRATDKKGVHVYAITSAETAKEACENIMGLLMSKEASYFWRLDAWAKD